jgi:hypothetical protein
LALKCWQQSFGLDPEFNDGDDRRWDTLGVHIAAGTMSGRIAYVFMVLGSGGAQMDALRPARRRRPRRPSGRTGVNREAVRRGLAVTGRTITRRRP